jgi:putative endonuclease
MSQNTTIATTTESAALEHAAAYFTRLGFTVLATNARTRWGSIDLVVHDGRVIVFCEVKGRVAHGTAVPWTSRGDHKRRQMRRLAGAWLASTPDRPRGRDVRFDAIGVLLTSPTDRRLERLEHIQAAF